MAEEDRAALLAAVNRLVLDAEAPRLYEALVDVVPLARRLGVRLTGALADLNPLVDIACRHPDHYDNVLLLVESKREQASLPPLDRQRNQIDKFDKSAYMAEFMQRKRDRERKAADIENMMRPERAKLVGRARLDFMQNQSAKWKRELDARLEAARAESPGRLRMDQLNVLRQSYWDQIDRELDDLEDYARTEMLKPVNQRRPAPH